LQQVEQWLRLLQRLAAGKGNPLDRIPEGQDFRGQLLSIGIMTGVRIVRGRIEAAWAAERATLEPNDGA
jgi:hypothetical protein